MKPETPHLLGLMKHCTQNADWRRGVAVVSMVALLAVAAGPSAEGSIPEGERPLEAVPVSRCATLGTVCVTAVAIPAVTCGKSGVPLLEKIWCVGSAVVGADGRSPWPWNLPGWVRYSGSGTCALDGSGQSAGNGFESWPGITGGPGGASGRSPFQVLTVCKADKFNGPGTQCVTLRVTARTLATASSGTAWPLAVPVETVEEDSRDKSAEGKICS